MAPPRYNRENSYGEPSYREPNYREPSYREPEPIGRDRPLRPDEDPWGDGSYR